MPDTVKLIVIGTKPEDIVKCTYIVSKVRKYIQRYANVQLFFVPSVKGFSGIAVEDEVFVKCDNEEESIEQVIDGVSKVVSRKKFLDLVIAAATIEK